MPAEISIGRRCVADVKRIQERRQIIDRVEPEEIPGECWIVSEVAAVEEKEKPDDPQHSQ